MRAGLCKVWPRGKQRDFEPHGTHSRSAWEIGSGAGLVLCLARNLGLWGTGCRAYILQRPARPLMPRRAAMALAGTAWSSARVARLSSGNWP